MCFDPQTQRTPAQRASLTSRKVAKLRGIVGPGPGSSLHSQFLRPHVDGYDFKAESTDFAFTWHRAQGPGKCVKCPCFQWRVLTFQVMKRWETKLFPVENIILMETIFRERKKKPSCLSRFILLSDWNFSIYRLIYVTIYITQSYSGYYSIW